jgi:nucleotide-binding universal stress UspA family protein
MSEKQQPIRILVPVDYSESSKKAVLYAFKIAGRIETRIHLFHAYYSPTLAFIELTDTSYAQTQVHEEVISTSKEQEEKNFEDFVNTVKSEISSELLKKTILEHTIEPGITQDAIIDFIASYAPDLVIMGSTGLGHKEKKFLGSVTESVIRQAKVPVLAIPDQYSFIGLENIDNILYLTQYDESDFFSLKALISLTSQLNLKVICVHISQDPSNSWDKIKMEGLKEYFKKVYEKVDVDCAIIEGKDIIKELDSYIQKNDIKALAITSRKRSLMDKVFKPNMTKKIFYHTSVPLLVFHT